MADELERTIAEIDAQIAGLLSRFDHVEGPEQDQLVDRLGDLRSRAAMLRGSAVSKPPKRPLEPFVSDCGEVSAEEEASVRLPPGRSFAAVARVQRGPDGRLVRVLPDGSQVPLQRSAAHKRALAMLTLAPARARLPQRLAPRIRGHLADRRPGAARARAARGKCRAGPGDDGELPGELAGDGGRRVRPGEPAPERDLDAIAALRRPPEWCANCGSPAPAGAALCVECEQDFTHSAAIAARQVARIKRRRERLQ